MRDGKFEWLELMRGLAALWVLIHHADQSVTHFIGSLGGAPLVSNGYLGVDFFFVLSGFIIASSSLRLFEEGGGATQYFRARFVRIYVPYLPVGIGIYALYMLLPGLSEGGRTYSVLTTLTLLPSVGAPALSVAWTLVHEMIFYAIFSLWFVSRRLFWLVMSGWVASIVGAYVAEVQLGRFIGYFLSPLNLCFALGVGVCMMMRRVSVSGKQAILAAIAGLVTVATQAMAESPERPWVAVGFCLIVIGAASPVGRAGRISNWLLSLGAASYAIYLVHNPVLSIAVRGVRAVFPDATPWVALVLISVVALLCGLAYWAFYERPALRLVRQWLASRRVEPAASAV